MVTVLLMVLFLAVVSIGLWAYSRSLLVNAAAQAARYAANADIADPEVAARYAHDLLAHTVAGSTAHTVTCRGEPAPDPMVGLRCTMAAPGVLPLLDGVLPEISVTAHALQETLP